MDIETEFDYPLRVSFPYGSKGGDQQTATFIKLSAPAAKHSKECGYLKQAFFVAADDAQARSVARGVDKKTKDASDDSDINPDDVLTAMASCVEVDYGEVLAVARKLFALGVAKVEGEVKLTAHLIENMDLEDLEQMTGAYMVRFPLASSLEKMNQSS